MRFFVIFSLFSATALALPLGTTDRNVLTARANEIASRDIGSDLTSGWNAFLTVMRGGHPHEDKAKDSVTTTSPASGPTSSASGPTSTASSATATSAGSMLPTPTSDSETPVQDKSAPDASPTGVAAAQDENTLAAGSGNASPSPLAAPEPTPANSEPSAEGSVTEQPQ